MNTYGYVGGNPGTVNDPLGLCAGGPRPDRENCAKELVKELLWCEVQRQGCNVACAIPCSRSGPFRSICSKVCAKAACQPRLKQCRATAYGKYGICTGNPEDAKDPDPEGNKEVK